MSFGLPDGREVPLKGRVRVAGLALAFDYPRAVQSAGERLVPTSKLGRSLATFVAMTLASCNEGEREGEREGASTNKPIRQIIIKKSGKSFEEGKFLSAYERNPNKFSETFFDDTFTVEGKIQSLSLVDPMKDLFPDRERVVTDYHIPLVTGNPAATLLGDSDSSPSVSVWMSDFTREDAAKLSPGQRITVECEGMRVVGDGLTFDGCKL